MTNRGFLPPYIDVGRTLLGGSWVVRTLSAMLYPFHMQFLRPPPTNALEDSLLSRNHLFKLDVLTPISLPRPPNNDMDSNEAAWTNPREWERRVKFEDQMTAQGEEEHPIVNMETIQETEEVNVHESQGDER